MALEMFGREKIRYLKSDGILFDPVHLPRFWKGVVKKARLDWSDVISRGIHPNFRSITESCLQWNSNDRSKTSLGTTLRNLRVDDI